MADRASSDEKFKGSVLFLDLGCLEAIVALDAVLEKPKSVVEPHFTSRCRIVPRISFKYDHRGHNLQSGPPVCPTFLRSFEKKMKAPKVARERHDSTPIAHKGNKSGPEESRNQVCVSNHCLLNAATLARIASHLIEPSLAKGCFRVFEARGFSIATHFSAISQFVE